MGLKDAVEAGEYTYCETGSAAAEGSTAEQLQAQLQVFAEQLQAQREQLARTWQELGHVGDVLIQHKGYTLEWEALLGRGATSLVFFVQARGGGPGYVAKVVKEAQHNHRREWEVLTALQPTVAAGAAIPRAVALCHNDKALLMLPVCQPLTKECVRTLPCLTGRQFRWLLPRVVFTLELAHKQGWVHNDIRPANLMLGPALAAGQLPASAQGVGAASVQPAIPHAAAAAHMPDSNQHFSAATEQPGLPQAAAGGAAAAGQSLAGTHAFGAAAGQLLPAHAAAAAAAWDRFGAGTVQLGQLQGGAAGQAASSFSMPHIGLVMSAQTAVMQAQQAEAATSHAIYIVDWGFATRAGTGFLHYGGTMKFASQRLLTLMAAGSAREECHVSPVDDLESLVKSFLALHHPLIASSLHSVPPGAWTVLLEIWQEWVDEYAHVFAAAQAGEYGSVAMYLQQLLPTL